MALEIFKVNGAENTTDKVAHIRLIFPEPVHYVALSSILNDHDLIYKWQFVKITDTCWEKAMTSSLVTRLAASLRRI